MFTAMVALVATSCVAFASAALSIDPETGLFLLPDGRVGLFHGLNAVYKLPPYHPELYQYDSQLSLNEQDMEWLAHNGFNMLRLGMLAEGVLPNELAGKPNSTYLDAMSALVDRLAEHGIYALIDAHQDCLSRQFCGEGFPDFMIASSNTTKEFPWPLPLQIDTDPATGYPNLTQCQETPFAAYEATDGVNSAWHGLFHDSDIRQHFENYWSAVAGAMAGKANLLGHELVNEPWGQNSWENPPETLDGPLMDKIHLMPLYERLHSAIRSVDKDAIVFYEPVVIETYLKQAPGFLSGPGGEKEADKQVLAYHLYCNARTSTGGFIDAERCNDYLTDIYNITMTKVDELPGGGFLTEFGACDDSASSVQVLNHYLDLADQRLQGWSYWNFKSYHDITTIDHVTETLFNADGSVQKPKLAALSRTYAQAIAGQPDTISMSFNASDPYREFKLEYVINPNVDKPETVIFYNREVHYYGGMGVTVSPPSAGYSSIGNNTVTVDHSAVTTATPVKIVIRSNGPLPPA